MNDEDKIMNDEDKILAEMVIKGYVPVEVLLKHFSISVENLGIEEKSAEKIEENDFMFLEID